MTRKTVLKVFSCVALLVASCAAQFQHIVIIVQENRTPDNLFGSAPPPGADVVARGGPIPLGTGANPDHKHSAYLFELKTWPPKTVAYVRQSDIQPYIDLANEYGFANRMFQTNEGSSTAAHLFLFAGTSAPSETSDLFESESSAGGCLNTSGKTWFIDPSGNEHIRGSACLNPNTLSDLLNSAGITWRYYTPTANSMWSAPTAIQHICIPNGPQKACYGSDWHNVAIPSPKILTDISNGKLAQVSWVIPAAGYSDHPGNGSGGPSWVASIVNAIGKSGYWKNTAILITWDDWGGWYDHVKPLANDTGWCSSYCYSFRVPLLMISANTPTNCIDNTDYHFGSILAFVEDNWHLPRMGHADSYANSLVGSNCLPSTTGTARAFKTIKARPLTASELANTGDPDEY
jgi:phospholipase C